MLYTVWAGQEPVLKTSSLNEALEFSDAYVYSDFYEISEQFASAVSWVKFVDDISDVEKAESENWVRTNVAIIVEPDDESRVFGRFFAFVLPRPSWDCGAYEMLKVGNNG